MKQKIGTVKGKEEPITDLDVVFLALYNLLYEKIESEPKKGIVVSKGNPNQRKATWGEVMKIAHMLEDFFALRLLRTGCRTCGECRYWEATSVTSPHIGECKKHGKTQLHKFSSCKKGFKPREETI